MMSDESIANGALLAQDARPEKRGQAANTGSFFDGEMFNRPIIT
jgi:hypothetical protein